MIKRVFLAFIVTSCLLLIACGDDPPPTEASVAPEPEVVAPEEQPGEVPEQPATEPTLAPGRPEVTERPSPTDFIRQLVEGGGVADPERVSATLFQLQSVPAGNGESYLFSFEDSNGQFTVACTMHTVLVPTEVSYETTTAPFVRCVPQTFADPISMFSSFSIDEAGGPADVVFGQIYSPDVVAIRVFFDGGDSVAVIGGGGYQANIPTGASGITVTAYDAQGGTLFNGTPLVN